MKTFLIGEELANTVLNYLALQPYKQVYQLIAELQRLRVAELVHEQTAMLDHDDKSG